MLRYGVDRDLFSNKPCIVARESIDARRGIQHYTLMRIEGIIGDRIIFKERVKGGMVIEEEVDRDRSVIPVFIAEDDPARLSDVRASRLKAENILLCIVWVMVKGLSVAEEVEVVSCWNDVKVQLLIRLNTVGNVDIVKAFGEIRAVSTIVPVPIPSENEGLVIVLTDVVPAVLFNLGDQRLFYIGPEGGRVHVVSERVCMGVRKYDVGFDTDVFKETHE